MSFSSAADVTVQFQNPVARFVQVPTVTTRRLRLLPLTSVDLSDRTNGVVDGLHAMRVQMPVMRWTRQATVDKTYDESLAWALKKQSDSLHAPGFVVQLLGSAETDGPLKTIGSFGGVGGTEIGYMLNGDYHGKGYATEAVKGLIQAYWEYVPSTATSVSDAERRPYDYVSAIVSAVNPGSIAILIKCGFTKVREFDEVDEPLQEWQLARPGTTLQPVEEDNLVLD